MFLYRNWAQIQFCQIYFFLLSHFVPLPSSLAQCLRLTRTICSPSCKKWAWGPQTPSHNTLPHPTLRYPTLPYPFFSLFHNDTSQIYSTSLSQAANRSPLLSRSSGTVCRRNHDRTGQGELPNFYVDPFFRYSFWHFLNISSLSDSIACSLELPLAVWLNRRVHLSVRFTERGTLMADPDKRDWWEIMQMRTVTLACPAPELETRQHLRPGNNHNYIKTPLSKVMGSNRD